MTSLFAHQAPDTLEPADRWQRQAECAATDETGAPVYDPEIFFPIGEGPVAQQQADDAKAVCFQCPVMDACLRSALENRDDVGVWGGLSEAERRRLHGRKAKTPAAPRKPRSLADALAAQSKALPGGHTEWTGSTPVTVNQVCYTPAQLAWHVAHSKAPDGQVNVECGHLGCITAAHLLDAAGRAEQHGSVAAYKAHLRRYETPCEECKAGRAARDRARRTKTADGCGTTTAYYQHLMAGEPVDEACQAASDAYEQQLTPAPEPAACGTRGGYQKHRRNGEQACDPCRQANADADRRLRNTGTTKQLTDDTRRPPAGGARCGTPEGYKAHRRWAEKACPACLEAHRAAARTAADAPSLPTCGTRSGYDTHTARGEAPCRPCTDARERTDWFLRESGTTKPLTERSAA